MPRNDKKNMSLRASTCRGVAISCFGLLNFELDLGFELCHLILSGIQDFLFQVISGGFVDCPSLRLIAEY